MTEDKAVGANQSVRHEVTMLGLGGGGVLTAGRLLAAAAMQEYSHALWYPSYFTSSRGGPCECTVVLSDEEVYSQLLDQSQVLVVLHPTQFKAAEPRVRPGGLIIAEQMGLLDRLERTDLRLVEVPAAQTALDKLGGIQGSNVVLLGTYLGIVHSVSPERVEQVIESRFQGRQAALESNLAAFRAGLELAARLETSGARVR